MTEKINKIQIRAEVFNAINSIAYNGESTKDSLSKAVNNISSIEDKDFLARLLIKEFIATEDTERAALISLLLLNCVPVEDIENNLWSNLALKTVSDKKKYQLIDLLKSLGKFIEYDKYLDYFEEPQTVIDLDTHKLLMTAMLNPEAQIDFLDFLATLNIQDKLLLTESMEEDYSSDDLANIIFPVIFSEKDKNLLQSVINKLVQSKSPLAYFPLTRFSNLCKDEELVKLVQKGLKELKIAGVTKEKAEEYYKTKFNNSILYICYSSIIDGKGNQGLLFSRIRSDNSIQVFCVVLNDKSGIVDCFGFNSISQTEFTLIVRKFYPLQSPLAITFETALSWLNEAEKISFENNNALPYEYICWKEILFDVNSEEDNPNETILKALNILPQKPFDIDKLLETDYFDKFYIIKEDNKNLSEFIDNIDKSLCEQNSIDIKEIENLIKDNIETIFDEETKQLIKNRLAKIAFCLMSNSKMDIASMINEMLKDKTLLYNFYKEMIKKSIFEFYTQEYQKRFQTKSDNIFVQRGQNNNSNLEENSIKLLLEKMLDEWGHDA